MTGWFSDALDAAQAKEDEEEKLRQIQAQANAGDVPVAAPAPSPAGAFFGQQLAQPAPVLEPPLNPNAGGFRDPVYNPPNVTPGGAYAPNPDMGVFTPFHPANEALFNKDNGILTPYVEPAREFMGNVGAVSGQLLDPFGIGAQFTEQVGLPSPEETGRFLGESTVGNSIEEFGLNAAFGGGWTGVDDILRMGSRGLSAADNVARAAMPEPNFAGANFGAGIPPINPMGGENVFGYGSRGAAPTDEAILAAQAEAAKNYAADLQRSLDANPSPRNPRGVEPAAPPPFPEPYPSFPEGTIGDYFPELAGTKQYDTTGRLVTGTPKLDEAFMNSPAARMGAPEAYNPDYIWTPERQAADEAMRNLGVGPEPVSRNAPEIDPISGNRSTPEAIGQNAPENVPILTNQIDDTAQQMRDAFQNVRRQEDILTGGGVQPTPQATPPPVSPFDDLLTRAPRMNPQELRAEAQRLIPIEGRMNAGQIIGELSKARDPQLDSMIQDISKRTSLGINDLRTGGDIQQRLTTEIDTLRDRLANAPRMDASVRQGVSRQLSALEKVKQQYFPESVLTGGGVPRVEPTQSTPPPASTPPEPPTGGMGGGTPPPDLPPEVAPPAWSGGPSSSQTVSLNPSVQRQINILNSGPPSSAVNGPPTGSAPPPGGPPGGQPPAGATPGAAPPPPGGTPTPTLVAQAGQAAPPNMLPQQAQDFVAAWLNKNRTDLANLYGNNAIAKGWGGFEDAINGRPRDHYVGKLLDRIDALTEGLARREAGHLRNAPGSTARKPGALDKAVNDAVDRELKQAFPNDPARQNSVRAELKALDKRGAEVGRDFEKLTTLHSRAKATMFGLFDEGIFAIQGASAMQHGIVPFVMGAIDEAAALMRLPHFVDMQAETGLPNILAAINSGVNLGGRNLDVGMEKGTLLRYALPPVDKHLITPLAAAKTEFEFAGVMGFVKERIFHGQMMIAKMNGLDVSSPKVQSAAAKAANDAGASGQLSSRATPVRRNLESIVPLTAGMTRAMVNNVVNMAQLINPVASHQQRIIAASAVLSHVAAIGGVGYLLNEKFGTKDWETNPFSPNFGTITLDKKDQNGKPISVNILSQAALERALLRSADALWDQKSGQLKVNTEELADAWARFGVGRAGLYINAGLRAAGWGYDSDGKFHKGDMSKEEALRASLPIPPVLNSVEKGKTPLQIGIEAFGKNTFTAFQSSALTPLREALKDDARLPEDIRGVEYKDLPPDGKAAVDKLIQQDKPDEYQKAIQARNENSNPVFEKYRETTAKIQQTVDERSTKLYDALREGRINGEQVRQGREIINSSAKAQRDAARNDPDYKKALSELEKNEVAKALDAYYKIWDSTPKLADGKVDYDKIELRQSQFLKFAEQKDPETAKLLRFELNTEKDRSNPLEKLYDLAKPMLERYGNIKEDYARSQAQRNNPREDAFLALLGYGKTQSPEAAQLLQQMRQSLPASNVPVAAGASTKPVSMSTAAPPPIAANPSAAMPAAPIKDYAFPVQGYSAKNVELHWGQDKGGADLFAPRGTPVLAMRGGEVISVGTTGLGGNNVTIRGSDGNQYYYAHGDRTPQVKVGETIPTGHFLFGVGDSGNAKGTGTHLHIGIGPEINRGSGPTGGSGKNFDAVGLMNSVLTGQTGPAPVGPEGRTVAQITGNPYLSDAERAWYFESRGLPIPGAAPARASASAPASFTPGSYPADVERWRGPVAEAFAARGLSPRDVDKALYVIAGESGGNPRAANPTSSARGLVQIMDFHAPLEKRFDPNFSINWMADAVAKRGWTDWGEGVLHEGKPFGILGFKPYPR